MSKEFWTITEVVELLEIQESFLVELEEEEVICPVCHEEPPKKLFTSSDLERLRLAKALVEDMGVNLAGVEVILRMRQNMDEMRRQFDAILEDLAQEIQETFRRGSS
jgi:MerR family transcriptional regulator/heat shock protein HspR